MLNGPSLYDPTMSNSDLIYSSSFPKSIHDKIAQAIIQNQAADDYTVTKMTDVELKKIEDINHFLNKIDQTLRMLDKIKSISTGIEFGKDLLEIYIKHQLVISSIQKNLSEIARVFFNNTSNKAFNFDLYSGILSGHHISHALGNIAFSIGPLSNENDRTQNLVYMIHYELPHILVLFYSFFKWLTKKKYYEFLPENSYLNNYTLEQMIVSSFIARCYSGSCMPTNPKYVYLSSVRTPLNVFIGEKVNSIDISQYINPELFTQLVYNLAGVPAENIHQKIRENPRLDFEEIFVDLTIDVVNYLEQDILYMKFKSKGPLVYNLSYVLSTVDLKKYGKFFSERLQYAIYQVQQGVETIDLELIANEENFHLTDIFLSGSGLAAESLNLKRLGAGLAPIHIEMMRNKTPIQVHINNTPDDCLLIQCWMVLDPCQDKNTFHDFSDLLAMLCRNLITGKMIMKKAA